MEYYEVVIVALCCLFLAIASVTQTLRLIDCQEELKHSRREEREQREKKWEIKSDHEKLLKSLDNLRDEFL